MAHVAKQYLSVPAMTGQLEFDYRILTGSKNCPLVSEKNRLYFLIISFFLKTSLDQRDARITKQLSLMDHTAAVQSQARVTCITTPHHTPQPLFLDHPGEPVPEENFWTLWCKGILTEARHSDHPAGCHSIRTN